MNDERDNSIKCSYRKESIKDFSKQFAKPESDSQIHKKQERTKDNHDNGMRDE